MEAVAGILPRVTVFFALTIVLRCRVLVAIMMETIVWLALTKMAR
jgi:hypothetical protein